MFIVDCLNCLRNRGIEKKHTHIGLLEVCGYYYNKLLFRNNQNIRFSRQLLFDVEKFYLFLGRMR